jgi:hypothetical protein
MLLARSTSAHCRRPRYRRRRQIGFLEVRHKQNNALKVLAGSQRLDETAFASFIATMWRFR